MKAYSVKYRFSQHFNVPAREAYDWFTDYQPNDLALMKVRGQRKISKINSDTVLLNETTYRNGKPIKKNKLVRLNEVGLSWSNTHVSGPNRYSQFLYEIVPVGKKASRLDFTGLLLYYSNTKPSGNKIKQLAEEERQHDSEVWRHLAKAIIREI
jgi:hypothetical protein